MRTRSTKWFTFGILAVVGLLGACAALWVSNTDYWVWARWRFSSRYGKVVKSSSSNAPLVETGKLIWKSDRMFYTAIFFKGVLTNVAGSWMRSPHTNDSYVIAAYIVGGSIGKDGVPLVPSKVLLSLATLTASADGRLGPVKVEGAEILLEGESLQDFLDNGPSEADVQKLLKGTVAPRR